METPIISQSVFSTQDLLLSGSQNYLKVDWTYPRQNVSRLTLASSTTNTTTPSTSAFSLNGIGNAISNVANLVFNWGRTTTLGGVLSGASAGAAIGSLFAPGIGTAIGAGIGGIVGAFSNLFSSGKSHDQKMRDGVRKMLLQQGIIDSNYTIGLADGSRYDIGIDGRPRAEFGGRKPYEVDFTNPLAGDVVGLVNPLANLIAGSDEKLSIAFAGYFANAATSNAGGDIEKARDNVRAIYSQFKMDPQDIVSGLAQLTSTGKITKDVFDAFMGGIGDLLSPQPYVMKAGGISS